VGRLLVRIAHFALVNILAGRAVVPELLQGDASPERMAAEVERLLGDPGAREAQVAGLREVAASLGEPGAARRVAEEVARAMG
jgi:lipid-A-disaccharide synthase